MNWRLAVGWVLAVVVTTAVAWQIVAIADERIGDRPISPLEAAAPGITHPPPSTVAEGASSPTTDEGATSTTSTTVAGSGTPTGTGSTTTSSTSTTTTTGGDEWTTETIVTDGGTIVVSYRPGEVLLETAVPATGFKVEIDKSGPPVVDVEFESDVLRVEIRVEWKDGELEVDVEDDSSGED